jgi:PAS domain S-box-containing protein
VDSTRFGWLRWAAVVAPAAFVAGLTYAAYFHLPGWLPQEAALALSVGVATAGAFIFSRFVFGQIEKRERENARLYERVQQTADYLDALIESSGDAMITVDSQGRILSWNRGAEEIYGWSRAEAIGQVLPMVPPDQLTAAQAMLGQLRAGGVLRNVEAIRQRKDGQLIDVIVTTSPLRNVAGEIIGALGTSKDISELKRLQRVLLAQQQSLAVWEERERIGMDLHDGAIQSLYSVGLRLESCLPLVAPAPDEVARRLEQAIEDVTDIIKQVRSYVFDLNAGQLPRRHLTERLAELTQELGGSAAIEVQFLADRIAIDASGQLSEAQATNLFLVAREALTNVVKHAQASAAVVRLSAEDGKLRLSVKDDGVGFDPQAVRAAGGHGLHNIAERAKLLGARLAIDSQPRAGTEISLEMPLTQEPSHA